RRRRVLVRGGVDGLVRPAVAVPAGGPWVSPRQFLPALRRREGPAPSLPARRGGRRRSPRDRGRRRRRPRLPGRQTGRDRLVSTRRPRVARGTGGRRRARNRAHAALP